MRKIITSVIIVAATMLATALNLKSGYAGEKENDAPILKLDTGGHMAQINKVIPMKDGRHIITASDDKTVRIWDTTTGEQTKKILGQIGDGTEGMIYAIALTPDERYLAVGGFLAEGHGVNYDLVGAIRIYELTTGKLVHVLRSHIKPVSDLSISSDGLYLVSASMDSTVKVWDIKKGFTLAHTFYGHIPGAYAVRIFKSGRDYHIVSAGFDNMVILWSFLEKKILKLYLHSDKLQFLSISDKYIAASGLFDKTTLIFDKDLNYQKSIKSGTVSAGIAFSSDGKLLLAGARGIRDKNCNIYDAAKNFTKITSFTKHGNLAMAVTFLDNNRAVSCGGSDFTINVWDVHTGVVNREIAGAGKKNWNVGIKGNKIAFGNKQIKVIDLDTQKIINLNPNAYKTFKDIPTTYKEYSLEHAKGGLFMHENATLLIKKNNVVTAQITRDDTDGVRHNTYGFTDSGVIISGGTSGFITAYSIDGVKLASFTGHSGEVWDISIYGDTLVSVSDDQIIKVWNLKELQSEFSEDPTIKVWYGTKIKARKIDIHPVVSIFVSKDNEWIIWNEQGFYNASPKADRFVGWHVNHGSEKSAEYYSAKQFRRYFYRPDIIKKTLELGSGKLALKEMAKKEPGLEKITVAELIKRAPVDVNIESVDIADSGYANVRVRLGMNNTTSPERITIYVNGSQVLTEKERTLKNAKPGDLLNYRVRLTDKKNHVKVAVENQWAENTASKTIELPEDKWPSSNNDSTLYIVAVGIKRYPNLSSEQQLYSPPIDANSIANKFKKINGTIYKNVDVLLLTDEDGKKITSDMVEKALSEQTRKAGPLDTTIIFLAGHGITDLKGNYHFVTADTNIKSVFAMQDGIGDKTSFGWNRLHKILDTTMGKRLVFVDTCQAGEVFSATKTDISKLVKDIHDVNAIVYSGTSRQDSGLETKDGGVFTLSLISGINGNAEYQKGMLSFLNLKKFVDQDVPSRNEKIRRKQFARAIKLEIIKQENDDEDSETQKPVAVIPDGMENFIIYAK